jgi:hypothetical protein
MAIERDLELLDDLISNRLTGEEKEAFEQRLESDPTLKNEYQLQQKLVEGIRNARVAELKTMLNNTPIPPASIGQSLLAKVAAWTVVSGIIATGIYFLLNKDQKEVVENNNKTVVENKVASEDTNKTVTQPSTTPALEEKSAVEKTEKKVVEVEKSSNKKNKKAFTDATRKTSSTDVAQRPNVFDPTGEDQSESNTRPDQPQAQIGTESITEVKASKLEVKMIDNDRKYTFHYQFKDGKILLYGSFERNLYEILEFFSDGKRTAFLYYKDNYYLLNEDDDKIKPLVVINNPMLLDKLKEFRSKSK